MSKYCHSSPAVVKECASICLYCFIFIGLEVIPFYFIFSRSISPPVVFNKLKCQMEVLLALFKNALSVWVLFECNICRWKTHTHSIWWSDIHCLITDDEFYNISKKSFLIIRLLLNRMMHLVRHSTCIHFFPLLLLCFIFQFSSVQFILLSNSLFFASLHSIIDIKDEEKRAQEWKREANEY